MPTRLLLRSRFPMIDCAPRTTANDSPASHPLTLSGQHAARSATRKALPRILGLAMPRKARATRTGVDADSTLTPLVGWNPAGERFCCIDCINTAGARHSRPSTTHSGRDRALALPATASRSASIASSLASSSCSSDSSTSCLDRRTRRCCASIGSACGPPPPAFASPTHLSWGPGYRR